MNRKIIFTLYLFLITPLYSQLPDPLSILNNADSTIHSLNSISYSAEYYRIGTHSVGDQQSIITPIMGNVLLQYIEVDDPLGYALSIEGFVGLQEFTVSYDGMKIRKLEHDKKRAYINDPDDIGKFLLVGGYSLILDLPRYENSLKEKIESSVVRYDGRALIRGVLCDIVYLRDTTQTHQRDVWWFISADDYFPRKKIVSFDEGNRITKSTIILSDVVINPKVQSSYFQLDVPLEYEVKVFEGLRPTEPSLIAGSKAPDWSLSDPSGEIYTLSDFKDNIVVIDFWATWCGPCVRVLPKLQMLHHKYYNQGVRVIGISTWEYGDPVKMMQEKGLEYLLLVDGDEVAEIYDVKGLPTLYVIGSEGKILYRKTGISDFEEIERIIKENIR